MMKNYDVVIVGAGPAGSIFAKSLAECGRNLKVLLIDGQGENHKKVCGGLLAPDAQEVLAKFGLTLPKGILEDPQIFAVDTVDLVSKENRCYKRHYLNMDRYAFDQWLLSLVAQSVEILKARCLLVERAGAQYLLQLQTPSGKIAVKTKAVVGADGASSVVRRCLFGKLPYQYVSIQQWYESGSKTIPPYSCIFDDKTSDSCSWTIRKNQYTVFGGAYQKEGCRKAFESQKARFEQYMGQNLGRPVKIEACLLTSPRKFSDFITGGEGAYLVGEAAGFISASSFEGISSAMLSGKMLAEAFAEGIDHQVIQRLYKKKTRRLRIKLYFKIYKMRILCSPFLRRIIMKSGVQSVKKFETALK